MRRCSQRVHTAPPSLRAPGDLVSASFSESKKPATTHAPKYIGEVDLIYPCRRKSRQ